MSQTQIGYYWLAHSSIYHTALDNGRTLCDIKVGLLQPWPNQGWQLTEYKPTDRTLCLSCRAALHRLTTAPPVAS